MTTLREAARIVSEEAEPYQETSCRPKYLVDAEYIDALRAALSAPRQGEPWGWATEGGGLCVGSMRQEWMLDTWFPVYRHAGAPPTEAKP